MAQQKKKSPPKIEIERQLSVGEIEKFFRIYKNHGTIVEAIPGGKTHKREDYEKKIVKR